MTGRIPGFRRGDAVLVVDPQLDFCPGGALPVPGGDAVMPVINAWMAAAAETSIPVFVSRDWHPPRTTHFEPHGGPWPAHCVMGSPGAEFHPDLRVPERARVFSKGMGETEDAYSAFQARDEAGALLPSALAESEVRHVYLLGLATDYCVKATGLDAREAGFAVTVVREAIGAVNLQPGDGEQALAALVDAGAELL
ncbi:MAG: isochorismatase family protein [Chloroflexi bacterium]|nr:isochorismatase family protein [Chloroflexota bacterium]